MRLLSRGSLPIMNRLKWFSMSQQAGGPPKPVAYPERKEIYTPYQRGKSGVGLYFSLDSHLFSERVENAGTYRRCHRTP